MKPQYLKLFKGIKKKHLKEAFENWLEFEGDANAFAESIEGAGRPRTRYLVRSKHEPAAPLKAVIKKAMLISGGNPKDGERLFNPDAAEKWLISKDWGYSCLRLLPDDEAHKDEKRHAKYVETLARPEQAKFRQDVLKSYSYSCAITQCTDIAALEAAHIVPKKDNGADSAENGILLRADLHRLFDANLLRINPENGRVHLEEELSAHYSEFVETTIAKPGNASSYSVFKARWEKQPRR